jgi:hypothetical protein
MEVTRVDAFEGALSMLGALKDQALGNEYWRKGCLREAWDDIIIDTIMTVFDTGKAETGVSIDGGSNWIVVEQYESEEAANAGHAKWIESMKRDPEQELHDLNLWG